MPFDRYTFEESINDMLAEGDVDGARRMMRDDGTLLSHRREEKLWTAIRKAEPKTEPARIRGVGSTEM